MSHPPLLPQTVRIKRKRQDEPVDTLHVHTQEDSKRRRHTEDQQQQQRQQQESPAQAVFRRVQDVHEPISETTALYSCAGRQQSFFSSSSSGPPPHSAGASGGGSSRTGTGPTGSSGGGRRILPTPQATRRFHLARGSHGSSSASSSTTGPAGGVVKKKRKNVATLVESKPKKRRSSDEISSAVSEYVARRVREQSGQSSAHAAEQQQPSPLKRPGKSSAVSTPRKGHAATPSEAHPQGQQQQQANANKSTASNGANAVDPGLLAEMQRFAHEVESAEQQQPAVGTSQPNSFQQQPSTPSRPSLTPQKLKFQPKPTPRYRARNLGASASPSNAMDIDAKPSTASSTAASDTSSLSSSEDDDDEGDYVYDTYILDSGPATVVLHNASSSAATAATMNSIPAQPLPPSVGLLIIRADDEPLWEAYADDDGAGADDGDEDAFDTDDEDSNAEDWRGNEYPDEEDDESGGESEISGQRGAKGLAIEDEEWDVRGLKGADVDSDGVGDGWGSSGDDAVWSDEEEERMRRPFAVPGWLKR
ncbi:hypothetical protein IWX49DRAFT_593595 [Phyllosticta citricarpa]|uniref:Transcription factor Iwr1 domain-containing protein n=1 Tax=Phyllosticta citricarpa TaxID=55181 RepID=A0ABR1MFI3_9PEZI